MRFVFLPLAHLQEVLALDEQSRKKMFIQVVVNFNPYYVGDASLLHELWLIGVTGTLETVKVPLSFFAPSGDGTAPDFSKVRLDDYGHTVCFGDYEAATDAIIEFAGKVENYTNNFPAFP
jgi:hypothetical protein